MTAFAALPKLDLADAAVGQIRDAILSGTIGAGEELPSERELALQLGLNRTTVRDVLTRLELLGLIDRRHGRRWRVLDYRRSGSYKLIPHLARLGQPGIGRSVRETTAILYEGTVALAAQRRTEGGLARLVDAVEALEHAVAGGSDEDIIRTDRAFHHTVAELADSVALELSVNDFYRAFDATYDASGSMKRSIAGVLRKLADQGESLPHRRLADAIAARDDAGARELAHFIVTGDR